MISNKFLGRDLYDPPLVYDVSIAGEKGMDNLDRHGSEVCKGCCFTLVGLSVMLFAIPILSSH